MGFGFSDVNCDLLNGFGHASFSKHFGFTPLIVKAVCFGLEKEGVGALGMGVVCWLTHYFFFLLRRRMRFL